MKALIWKTVLQPEPQRLPNNGSKTVSPMVYEHFGRVVVDSQDLAYFIGVSQDRLVQAWDRVISAADPDWRATHYLPRTETFGIRAGKPYHNRDVRMTREAAQLALQRINKKKANAAIAIFEAAEAQGRIVREPSRRASDIRAAEAAQARSRVHERTANGTNCADGDEAEVALDDDRWTGIRFEIIRPTVRNPAGDGQAWECKAYRVDARGYHQLVPVPAFDVRSQTWVRDQFVTIPDALLTSLTAAEDRQLLSERGCHE